ncbi:guanine nucleotide-binding protein G(I)/G(S)/G(O) subunit gamma-13b [Tachysurus ichikawai]
MDEMDVPQLKKEVESLKYQLAFKREKSSKTVTDNHQNLRSFNIIAISVSVPDLSSEIPVIMNQRETPPTRNMLDVCHFYRLQNSSEDQQQFQFSRI